MRAMKAQDPDLTVSKFLKRLSQELGGDVDNFYRAQWEQVGLKRGHNITPFEWRNFLRILTWRGSGFRNSVKGKLRGNWRRSSLTNSAGV